MAEIILVRYREKKVDYSALSYISMLVYRKSFAPLSKPFYNDLFDLNSFLDLNALISADCNIVALRLKC